MDDTISRQAMSDLISRQDAIEAIEKHKHNVLDGRRWDEGIESAYAAAHNHICDVISRIPTAERVGKWIKAEKGGEWWCACSICSMHIPKTLWGQDWHSSYCPNCGARMEGDGDDQ